MSLTRHVAGLLSYEPQMKKTILTAALLALCIPAFAGVKVIGTLPNGDKIVRIKTAGLFCPATTTIVTVSAAGDVSTLNSAGGPGFIPAVATAGGVVGGAALLRPSKTSVKNETGAYSESKATGGSAAGGNGGNGGSASGNSFVPPGHLNNPSNNH
jgi:hypothetical protein